MEAEGLAQEVASNESKPEDSAEGAAAAKLKRAERFGITPPTSTIHPYEEGIDPALPWSERKRLFPNYFTAVTAINEPNTNVQAYGYEEKEWQLGRPEVCCADP